MLKPTQKLTVLVPVADNDGKPFRAMDYDLLEGHILAQAGGFTRQAPVQGGWRSPSGQVFLESMIPYAILGDNVLPVANFLEQYVQAAFAQQAVYVEVQTVLATV